MATRNPMNKRYQGDGVEGQSRKSAASAKPKTKAASSVRMKTAPVTKQDKQKAQAAQEKADRKAANARLSAAGSPTDPKYKYWRRWWWITLVIAILATTASWGLRVIVPSSAVPSYIALGFAYITIIAALVIDFKCIRPIRQAFQAQAMKPLSKSQQRKLEKETAEQEAVKAAQKEAEAAAKAAKKTSKKNKDKAEAVAAMIAAEEGTTKAASVDDITDAKADATDKKDN